MGFNGKGTGMTQPARQRTEVYYPESDGEPMGETGIHVHTILALYDALKRYFRWRRPDVYVAANQFLYYQEGDPRKVVAPDVFVVFGLDNRFRRIYKLWEEGQAPSVVFEISSASTQNTDMGFKRQLYASLGVQEYVLADILHEYLSEPLQLYRLVQGVLQPHPVLHAGENRWRAHLETLGLDVELQSTDEDFYRLRLVDPERNRELAAFDTLDEHVAELAAELAETRERVKEEEARRREEEARRREEEARRREAEKRKREAEKREREASTRALQEAQARRAAEERLQQLEAELKRLRGENSHE